MSDTSRVSALAPTPPHLRIRRVGVPRLPLGALLLGLALVISPAGIERAAAQTPEYVPGMMILGVGNGIGIPAFPGSIAGYNIIDRADMNLDGHLDLILAAPGVQHVFVFHGDGNGFLMPGDDIAVSGQALSVLAADFNEDGRPDIVTSDGDAGTITIHRSNPAGTGYLTPYSAITGSRPVRAYSGDFDEDQHLDLVVVDEIDSTVSLLRGTGYGTFLPPQTSFVEVDDSLESLTIDDLDDDGHLDLVVPCPLQDLVAVLRGIGNGSFLPVEIYPVGINPGPLSVADHDGDGHKDVIVPNRFSNSFSWLRGDGTGALLPPQSTSTNIPPISTHSFRSAPNADEHVAVAQFAPELKVYANFSPGAAPLLGLVPTDFPPEHITSGDFDEDGFTDIVVVSELFSMIQIFFQVPYTIPSFRRGDTDADGNLDIVDVVVLLDAVFQSGPGPCADRHDVNDDGRIDLADPIALLGVVFGPGTTVPSPYPECGVDPTDDALGTCYDPCGG